MTKIFVETYFEIFRCNKDIMCFLRDFLFVAFQQSFFYSYEERRRKRKRSKICSVNVRGSWPSDMTVERPINDED
jgi:hypothetical protein